MSRYDFHIASTSLAGAPFAALIMAAVLGADTDSAIRLRGAFPKLYAETCARYNAPGGILDTDTTGGDS